MAECRAMGRLLLPLNLRIPQKEIRRVKDFHMVAKSKSSPERLRQRIAEARAEDRFTDLQKGVSILELCSEKTENRVAAVWDVAARPDDTHMREERCCSPRDAVRFVNPLCSSAEAFEKDFDTTREEPTVETGGKYGKENDGDYQRKVEKKLLEVLTKVMKENVVGSSVSMDMIHTMLAEEEVSEAKPEVFGIKDGSERVESSSMIRNEGEAKIENLTNEGEKKIVMLPLRADAPSMAGASPAAAVPTAPSMLIVDAYTSNPILNGSKDVEHATQKWMKIAHGSGKPDAKCTQSFVYDRGKAILVA
jgi:hypothetical protein